MIGSLIFLTRLLVAAKKGGFVTKMIGDLTFTTETIDCSVKRGIFHQNDRGFETLLLRLLNAV